MLPPPAKLGFSLVELSIVLVILGLLVGGVLSGQSLIRAAELRSVTNDYSRYIAAVQTFRDKYFALPGDMSNATLFWGRTAATADCVTNSSATVAAPGTCDGNANGRLAFAPAASQSGEAFQFWKHLALAGLIEGQYSGYAGSGVQWHVIANTNAPASKISSSAWYIADYGIAAGDTIRYALDYGNSLSLGKTTPTSTAFDALLKPEDAWNIDTKLDDGKPAYGRLVSLYWNNACSAADDGSSANNDLNASYLLTNNTASCTLEFVKAF